MCDGLNRIGWHVAPPKGTMFVWAPIPEPYREMGSLEFSKYLVSEADVATSPGVGLRAGGDGHVRFALIENEQRIGQAVRNLRTRADQARLVRAELQGSPAPGTLVRTFSMAPLRSARAFLSWLSTAVTR